jgi:iron-sulfur cluster repair protein YtfE (RIC family)
MDAIQLLKKDHEHVATLFSRYHGGGGITGLVKRVTGNVPPRERRSALEQICRELEAHTQIEEEIFYPAVRGTGDAELRRLVDESLREHQRVKQQVSQLRGRSPERDDVDERVTALEKDVEHHVSEEENEMFPRVEQWIGERERAELGKRMQARKQAAKNGRARAASARTRARDLARRRAQRGRKTAAPKSRAKTSARKRVRRQSARSR